MKRRHVYFQWWLSCSQREAAAHAESGAKTKGMPVRKFRSRERKLTYANVVATLALFFALTGGAWAATSKYLMASDPVTQGDLAGSTYGNPVIAGGKVTTGKIADGAITTSKFDSTALAPNSDKLDGKDSSAFATIGGRGTVTFSDVVLAAGQCASGGVGAPAGTDLATDFVLAQPPAGLFGGATDISVTGGLGTIEGDPLVVVTVCNGYGGGATISATFKWLLLHST